MKLNIKGIKCDACDYKDESVSVENYDNWLNKPCPKCGSNLLTQADFDNVKMIIKLEKIVYEASQEVNDEEIVKTSIEMNGTGDMNFKVNNSHIMSLKATKKKKKENGSPCGECYGKPCQFLDGDPRCDKYRKWERGNQYE